MANFVTRSIPLTGWDHAYRYPGLEDEPPPDTADLLSALATVTGGAAFDVARSKEGRVVNSCHRATAFPGTNQKSTEDVLFQTRDLEALGFSVSGHSIRSRHKLGTRIQLKVISPSCGVGHQICPDFEMVRLIVNAIVLAGSQMKPTLRHFSQRKGNVVRPCLIPRLHEETLLRFIYTVGTRAKLMNLFGTVL